MEAPKAYEVFSHGQDHGAVLPYRRLLPAIRSAARTAPARANFKIVQEVKPSEGKDFQTSHQRKGEIMAAPYFLDLRRKVVQACNRPGQSQRAVAELFGVMVVMDNLAAYKVDGIRSASEATGAALMFLPPYSPDDSPIKPCWSKLKTCLRAIGGCQASCRLK